MLKTKVFLVIDSDFFKRKKVIDSIKKDLVKIKDPSLNTQVFYSKDIDLNNLKQALFSFSFDREKIVFFKGAQDLSKEIREFIHLNLKKIVNNNYLIFELEKDYLTLKQDKRFLADKLYGYLFKHASVYGRKNYSPESISISSLMSMVRKNKLNESIYALEDIFAQGRTKKDLKNVLGMQILGALTREFSYVRAPAEKERCFNLIWNTERALKEGSLEARLALELLITKLLLR